MPAFHYKAVDSKGKETKGVIEGDSPRHARQLIRMQGLKTTDIKQSKTHASPLQFTFQRNLKLTELSLLMRQLSTLIQAQITVDEALQATAKQTKKNNIKSLLLSLRSQVLEGKSLGQAMDSFPQAFPSMYRAMIKAGEHAGFLDAVLLRLADYTERRQALNQSIAQAVIYPIILTTVAISVISLLMVFVIPKLTRIFQNSGEALPPLTQGLILLSDFFTHYGSWCLAVIICALLLGKQLLKIEKVLQSWHNLLLHIPIIGVLIKELESTRYLGTLSTLIGSGVPLSEALSISNKVVSNYVLQRDYQSITKAVTEGSDLHSAMERTNHFQPMAVYMIASGETSSELEAMLSRTAQNQETGLQNLIDMTMAIFAPLMVIGMAVIVFLIVFAILLPIFDLNTLIQ